MKKKVKVYFEINGVTHHDGRLGGCWFGNNPSENT